MRDSMNCGCVYFWCLMCPTPLSVLSYCLVVQVNFIEPEFCFILPWVFFFGPKWCIVSVIPRFITYRCLYVVPLVVWESILETNQTCWVSKVFLGVFFFSSCEFLHGIKGKRVFKRWTNHVGHFVTTVNFDLFIKKKKILMYICSWVVFMQLLLYEVHLPCSSTECLIY